MKTYVVDRAALQENVRLIRQTAAPAAVWGVVKGDGYGLGVLPFARVMKEQGIDRFAVTEVKEAKLLRENGFEQELILMLRATSNEKELEQLIGLNVIATIGTFEDAQALDRVATRLGTVGEAHIKLDTGMGRYGFLPEELTRVEAIYDQMEHIALTGIYTHFSCAYCDQKKTREQFSAFRNTVDQLIAAGYSVGEVHCANSSALFLAPETKCDSVRVGSAMLGRLSFRSRTGLKRIGWAEATVEELRTLPQGWSVGYGAGYITKKRTTIAVLDIGYYHGFGVEYGRDIFRFRDALRGSLSLFKAWVTHKKLYVNLNGKRCPVLGHVGMLHTVVDVTGLEVRQGDVARLEMNPLNRKGIPVEYR